VNHAVSLDGKYAGVATGNDPVLSAGTTGMVHMFCVWVLNHVITSSIGAGWNQDESSLADTGTIENPKMKRNPNIRPILAILLIFIVIPRVIS
jgi:hypothetical protein